MRETRIICDRCRDSVDEAEYGSVCVTVNRRMDAAGRMDDEQECVDLCVRCLARELMAGLAALTMEARRFWVERVREIGEAACKAR